MNPVKGQIWTRKADGREATIMAVDVDGETVVILLSGSFFLTTVDDLQEDYSAPKPPLPENLYAIAYTDGTVSDIYRNLDDMRQAAGEANPLVLGLMELTPNWT